MRKSRFNTKQFIKHIHSFMDSMELLSPKKSIVVAVSGGVDSIALMYVMHEICGGKIKVLHINHGTRPENIDEENLVIGHCKKLNIEVEVFRFTLNFNQNNFEAIARNLRSEVYKQYLQKNYWVYTAHHLDDSFEWSMIQSFRQSSLTSTLGIPVFNRGLVRPFMCVSKNQIIQYAKTLDLSWATDSSNRNLRFERNFFRAKLTQTIFKRYPQYLRHYVAKQNELALKLSIHRSLFLQKKTSPHSRLIEKREISGAVVLKSSDFSFHKDLIKEWIHFFSKTHRGELDREVDKLILAHKKIKDDEKELKIKGPLSFSGGVKIFVLDDYLLISNDSNLDFYRRCDDSLLGIFKTKAASQITERSSLNHTKKLFFPYLTLLKITDKKMATKLIHPLLPRSTEWMKKHDIPYTFYPLLKKKLKTGKQKLIHDALILDSFILGL